jgi:hypothetical protein
MAAAVVSSPSGRPRLAQAACAPARAAVAVTGGLAGAVYGLPAIPARRTGPPHVPVPGRPGRVLRLAELTDMAVRLDFSPSGD